MTPSRLNLRVAPARNTVETAHVPCDQYSGFYIIADRTTPCSVRRTPFTHYLPDLFCFRSSAGLDENIAYDHCLLFPPSRQSREESRSSPAELFSSALGRLSDCCIMQTGQYVCDQAPLPNTAGARAIAEAYSAGTLALPSTRSHDGGWRAPRLHNVCLRERRRQ